MDTDKECFKCTFCEKSFARCSSLRSHNLQRHKEYSKLDVACPVCPETFNYRKDLQLHLSTVHGVPIEDDMLLVMGTDTKYHFKCIFCEKDYRTEISLKKHIAKHGVPIEEYLHLSKGMNAKLFKCLFCENCYRNEAVLKKHISTHGVPVEDNMILVVSGVNKKSFHCTICETSFNADRNLKRHMQLCHGCIFDLKKSKKCPGCDENFRFWKDLRFHVSTVHEIPIEVEEHQFNTFQDFELWKREMEEATNSFYIKQDVRKSKRTSSKMFLDYACNKTAIKKKQRLALALSRNTKINGYCPSSINIVATAEGLDVKFFKSHYHNLHNSKCPYIASNMNTHEIQRCNMLKQDSKRVLLKQACKRDLSKQTSIKDLIKQASKKDLFKQASRSQLQLLNNTYEYTTIHSWVTLMNCIKEDVPIVYYKGRGEVDPSGNLGVDDFHIVIMTKYQEKVLKKYNHLNLCIDSTHSALPGDFHIIAVLVVDEFGCGCPIAFWLSNQIEEKGVETFFNAIKQKVGIIRVNVFMSDDVPEFYNIWCKVMGPSHLQLLCPWYVNKRWHKNIKIIQTFEQRIKVSATLKALMQAREQKEFELHHSELFATMYGKGGDKFKHYFKKYYSSRCKMWAYCYRSQLGIGENRYLDSTHKVLNDLHLEWECEKNLGRTLHKLLKISRDECLKRLIEVTESISSSQVKKSEENHVKSKEILYNMIIQIKENCWVIRHLFDAGPRYNVKKLQNALCGNKCKLVCNDCNTCIHMYECTCLDNFIQCVICEHIHACASRCVTKPTSSTETVCDKTAEAAPALDTREETNAIKSLLFIIDSNVEQTMDHLMGETRTENVCDNAETHDVSQTCQDALDASEETNAIIPKTVENKTDFENKMGIVETSSVDGDVGTAKLSDMGEENSTPFDLTQDDNIKTTEAVCDSAETGDVMPCEETNSGNSLDLIKNIVERKLEHLRNEMRSKILSEEDYYELSKSVDYCLSLYAKADIVHVSSTSNVITHHPDSVQNLITQLPVKPNEEFLYVHTGFDHNY